MSSTNFYQNSALWQCVVRFILSANQAHVGKHVGAFSLAVTKPAENKLEERPQTCKAPTRAGGADIRHRCARCSRNDPDIPTRSTPHSNVVNWQGYMYCIVSFNSGIVLFPEYSTMTGTYILLVTKIQDRTIAIQLIHVITHGHDGHTAQSFSRTPFAIYFSLYRPTKHALDGSYRHYWLVHLAHFESVYTMGTCLCIMRNICKWYA
jgi:hypothetical protein